MKRRLAREVAVQCLYQLEMNTVTPEEAIAMIAEEVEQEDNEIGVTKVEWPNVVDYVQTLISGVMQHRLAIDDLVSQHLTGWKVDRLSRVDLQILRVATFEMVFSDDVPAKAAINEAVDIAKHFGTDESGKFVNGVLGKLLPKLETTTEPVEEEN